MCEQANSTKHARHAYLVADVLQNKEADLKLRRLNVKSASQQAWNGELLPFYQNMNPNVKILQIKPLNNSLG